jgi:hypothetical protein
MAGHAKNASKQEGYIAPERTEAVYFENTLLRVFGVLFCHDPKRARARTGKLEIDRGVKERNITVRLSWARKQREGLWCNDKLWS